MIFLISQDWVNTSNNHAGIKYLCNELQHRYPNEFLSIVLPDFVGTPKYNNKICEKILRLRAKYLHKKEKEKVYKFLCNRVKQHDKIILMEYMVLQFRMYDLAQAIKQNISGVQIYAMVHLVPVRLEKLLFNDEEIYRWTNSIDKILTLGSSLTEYLVNKGIPKEKVVTTFHYVDEYYYKTGLNYITRTPTVIAMGNQMRNQELLKQIVDENPKTKFIICQGLNDLSSIFASNKNVQLIPFVPESKLRELMDRSDISLNVMEDTIGSNVIVTSLAMGLAMICSDVGSIHNYCDEDNTIFCKEMSEYSKAISLLSNNKRLLYSMKQSAMDASKKLSIEKFRDFIINL